MKSISHRTQIVYETDAALIISLLQLNASSSIAEAGTGSGSLTSILARVCDKVFTFEFHAERCESAKNYFREMKFDNISTEHRDVCSQGFPNIKVNAVFLDLPNPWAAVSHENGPSSILESEGLVCTFSPCIEQVEQTCRVLKKHQFVDIRTFESIQRSFRIRERRLSCRVLKTSSEKPVREKNVECRQNNSRGHTAYITIARKN